MEQSKQFNRRLLLKLNNLTRRKALHWGYRIVDVYTAELGGINLVLSDSCLLVTMDGAITALRDPEDSIKELHNLAGGAYLSPKERVEIDLLTALEKAADEAAPMHWGINTAAGVK